MAPRKRKRQNFTIRNRNKKGSPVSSIVTRVLPPLTAWRTNEDKTLTNGSRSLLRQIKKDSLHVTWASLHASYVVHAVISKWFEDICSDGNGPPHNGLPPMLLQKTWEHLVKFDHSNCDVHPRITEARQFMAPQFGHSIPHSSNNNRQDTYTGVNMMTDFANFMNNLPLYIKWYATDYLRKNNPTMSKKQLKNSAEVFALKVCNIPHRRDPEELRTTDALELIQLFRDVLQLDHDDHDTKIDEAWIKKDIKDGNNLSIKLVCFLSKRQIDESNEDYQCRKIPICPISTAKSKFATYNSRESISLLQSCDLWPRGTSKQKAVVFGLLSHHLCFENFEKNTPRTKTVFRSFMGNGVQTCLRFDKEVKPKPLENNPSQEPEFPESVTTFNRGNGTETLFGHGSDMTKIRGVCLNGRVVTGNDLLNCLVVAIDPGVIQSTTCVLRFYADGSFEILDKRVLTTRHLYEASWINKFARYATKNWKASLQEHETQLSQLGSLKSPSPESLVSHLEINRGKSWLSTLVKKIQIAQGFFPDDVVKHIVSFLDDMPSDLELHVSMNSTDEAKNYRLTTHIERQRLIDQHTAHIKKLKNSIVLFESGKFSPTAGGNQAVPMNQITESFAEASGGNFLIVPAFRTSSICPTCQNPLCSMKKKGSYPIRGVKYCATCKTIWDRDEVGAVNTGLSGVFHPSIFDIHTDAGKNKLPKKTIVVPNQIPTSKRSRYSKLSNVQHVNSILTTSSERARFLSVNSFDDLYKWLSRKMSVACWVNNLFRTFVCIRDLEIVLHWLVVAGTHPFFQLHRNDFTQRDQMVSNIFKGHSPFYQIAASTPMENETAIALLAHFINVNALLKSMRGDSQEESISSTDELDNILENIDILGEETMQLGDSSNSSSKWQNVLISSTKRSPGGYAKIRKSVRKYAPVKSKEDKSPNIFSSTDPSPELPSMISTLTGTESTNSSPMNPSSNTVSSTLLSTELSFNGLRPNVFGLLNLGNTCYQNACYQMLLSCRVLLRDMLNVVRNASPLFESLMPFSCMLLHLASTSEDVAVVNPSMLVRRVSAELNMQIPNRHDMREFKTKLFDTISKELTAASNSSTTDKIMGTFYTNSKVACSKCGATSETNNVRHNELFVNLDGGATISLQSHISHMVEKRDLCCGCDGTNNVPQNGIITFSREAPNTMFIHVVRESFNAEDGRVQLVSTPLQFQSEVRFPNFGMYELVALGVHIESKKHYVSYGITSDNWHKFDDTRTSTIASIEDITSDSEIQKEVTLLVYSLQPNRDEDDGSLRSEQPNSNEDDGDISMECGDGDIPMVMGCEDNEDSPTTSSDPPRAPPANLARLAMIPINRDECASALKTLMGCPHDEPNYLAPVPKKYQNAVRKTIVLGEKDDANSHTTSLGNVTLGRSSVTGIKSTLISRQLCTLAIGFKRGRARASITMLKELEHHAVFLNGEPLERPVGKELELVDGDILSLYGPVTFAYRIQLSS